MAAGLAATGAAFVTSRFGVAGTLLGAAVTAMIITGGSAVLKAYIATASDRFRSDATRLRRVNGGGQTPPPEAPTAQNDPTQAHNPPGRPDLRDNFAGRMRAAVDWFRNLPTSGRRPILIKALLAALVAFVICLVAIWAVEKVIGNSLSCGLWGSCPVGAAPGIHIAGFDDSGAGSTLSGGDVDLGGGGSAIDSIRQGGGGGLPDGVDIIPGGGGEDPSSASPAPGGEDPSSASPEPEEPPASASPAAEQRGNADASASPAAQ
jgi:hypothetical protein